MSEFPTYYSAGSLPEFPLGLPHKTALVARALYSIPVVLGSTYNWCYENDEDSARLAFNPDMRYRELGIKWSFQEHKRNSRLRKTPPR